MKVRSRVACLSAAVAACLWAVGGASAQTRTLTWDANGTDAPLGADGSGLWDTSSPTWVDGDLTTGTNVAWSNTPGDSAVFGNSTNAFNNAADQNSVDMGAAIT